MAKLPTLVSAIAEVDGRERSAVDHYARTIRERGYITTGKRGGGAADMTVREAANLLIALNGADSAKDAPLAIDRFRSLRQWYAGTATDLRERVESYDHQIKPVQDLMDVHTFGEAMDVLIEDVPELMAAFYAYAEENYATAAPTRLLGMLRLRMFGVDVTFRRYAAKIQIFNMNGSERRVEFEANYTPDTDRHKSGFYGQAWPDREVSVTIGAPTLIAAWQVLHPGEDLPGVPAGPLGPDDE